ncbi:phosphoribosylglycinamide formyltransferase [Candidatus Micrarchaeota archaeon]|nr:phosphoribosylglycinamide formyltransferase [Candidatus Micrarchaeota archaeon]
MAKVKVAVLASGRGSNFKAIQEHIKAGRCDAEIKVLITNNPDAPAISIAKDNKIPVEIIDKSGFPDREKMDERIKELLDRYGAELVVLAGYMLILKGRKLLESYKNRIINIHPALLPAFPGATAQKDAFEYGVKVSGVTIHFVDESLDAGPIIYQEAVDISDCKSAEETAAKILKTEHKAYAKVVDSFSKGHYAVEGRRARFVPSS